MITAVVLHYNRPDNVKKWMDGIRKQTVHCDVLVWDNSGNYPQGSGEDILIRSSKNFYCQPRYLCAGLVRTEYIYNQDDDLALKDINLFEKFIEYTKEFPDVVIGWNGRKFKKNINWEKAYSFPNTGEGGGWVDYDEYKNIDCDMINYGVSFHRTELINQISINPFFNNKYPVDENEYKYGDDMWISIQLAKKKVMPFPLKDLFEWLPEGMGLSKQSPHMMYRDKLSKRYWKDKYD
jgi:hypothetical protein